MGLTAEEIKQISEEVISEIKNGENQSSSKDEASTASSKPEWSDVGPVTLDNSPGIYSDMETAIQEAEKAQSVLDKISLEERKEIIKKMREVSLENSEYLGQMAHEETGFGKPEDKNKKNILAATKTPGTEDLTSTTFTGDDGMTLVEEAPYGIIGAITPSTNPTSTVINNSISMVAAGNTVVYNPHPGAKKCSQETIKILNQAIRDCGHDVNLLFAPEEPTLDSSQKLMNHESIRILAVTGGEKVVEIAMQTGKKVIAAGPGNPPVIVDDTADIHKAARDIVDGASFDNNVLCIAEKEVFVFDEVAGLLVDNMVDYDCYLANSQETRKIQDTILKQTEEGFVPNKEFVGKDANYILKESGIHPEKEYKLVITEVDSDHPFVTTEKLMPVLPIVRVNSLGTAISQAKNAEDENYHTAIMHSHDVTNLSKAAKSLNTTIFVKNAPSYAGLGFNGEGFTTLTIATPTGEGLTSAKSFTRERRCTLAGSFRII